MATFSFLSDTLGITSQTFKMDDLVVSKLVSADVKTSKSQLFALEVDSKTSAEFVGGGLTYDANDWPTGGFINGIKYQDHNGTGFGFQINGFSVPAADLWGVVLEGSTQTAFAALFAGDDVFQGSAYNDQMRGYDGADTLYGYGGADTLTGGAGADLFTGISGGDVITDFNGAAGDRLLLAPGTTYTLESISAGTLVKISDGSQVTLSGVSVASVRGEWFGGSAPAGPTFETISPDAALAISATDKLAFAGGTATAVSVGYNADSITISMNGLSKVFGNNVAAVSQSGNISMPDGSKFFIGAQGAVAETFTGAATGDAAFGGLGNDTLDGGAGSDLLQGNQGSDRLLGGDGNDTVYGGQDDDVLVLGAGANFGQGNRGADLITGGVGVDTLLGGQDNDTVQGDAGADFVNGNRGDDTLSGGDGNDTLYGEAGADTLAGGAGADVFHAFAGQETDRIVDFSRAEGDRIVLNAGMTHSESQVGADVVVNLGGGDQFVLANVTLATLTGDWIGL